MSINKVIVTGNLTRDPELRETGDGLQILSFGVAVNDRRKNQQTQQWEDRPNFVDCTMFGNRAASAAASCPRARRSPSRASCAGPNGRRRTEPAEAS